MSLYNLSHTLKEWTEIDISAFHIAVALDILPPLSDEKEIYNFGGKKHIFWTNNPMGNMLFDLLESLVILNVLEKQDTDDELYRWNPDFDLGNL